MITFWAFTQNQSAGAWYFAKRQTNTDKTITCFLLLAFANKQTCTILFTAWFKILSVSITLLFSTKGVHLPISPLIFWWKSDPLEQNYIWTGAHDVKTKDRGSKWRQHDMSRKSFALLFTISLNGFCLKWGVLQQSQQVEVELLANNETCQSGCEKAPLEKRSPLLFSSWF